MTEPARAVPLLKWCGGKIWAAKQFGDDLFAHLNQHRTAYFEPFLGGGAMALHLGWERMFLSDIEEDLIEVYAALQQDPLRLNEILREMEPITSDEGYYAIRDEFPEDADLFMRAARVVYLNKRCFNGLYRKNASGKFNVGPGRWPSGPPPLPDLERLEAAGRALAGATLMNRDFEPVIRAAGPGDLVYCDPPYVGTATIGRPGKKGSNPSFDKYSANGFSLIDQERLARCLRAAHNRGAAVLAHNSDSEEVRDWYGWAEVLRVDERRSVSCDGGGRKPAPCVLIASCPTL